MSVRAFGKFFSWEETLFWQGWKNEEGKYARILGHELSRQAYKDPVRQAEVEFSTAPGIYLLHDQFGKTIYVGQAKRLAARLITHSGDHLRNRWTHYSWFATEQGNTPNESYGIGKENAELENAEDNADTLSLNILEAVLRTAMEPRLNLQGGRWERAKQYAQSVEYEFVYLREVYDEVRSLKKKNKKVLKRLQAQTNPE